MSCGGCSRNKKKLNEKMTPAERIIYLEKLERIKARKKTDRKKRLKLLKKNARRM